MTDEMIDEWVGDIHCGDSAETLAEMPDDSVHFAMTSPPYFNLRDYGEDGQIGLEDSLGEYIENLLEVGDELHRVLRDDGSFWLNLGDCFNTNRGDHYGGLRSDVSKDEQGYTSHGRSTTDIKRKCKMLVPARVAIAFIDSGWVLRNDVPWIKPNPMPNSVKDRLNTTFEFVFHFAPEPDYWYDLDAIREPHADASVKRDSRGRDPDQKWEDGPPGQSPHGGMQSSDEQDMLHPRGKNPGDVFEITTKPFPDAHFAVYPPELVETPLKATCPPKVCAGCGAPYDRDTERVSGSDANIDGEVDEKGRPRHTAGLDEKSADEKRYEAKMLGWVPTCECETDETEPGIALDPFAGSGTTCKVAKDHARRFVGIDLSPEYVAMAQKRVGLPVDDPSFITDHDDQTGVADFGGGDDS